MAFIENTVESKIVYEGPIFKIRQHTVNTVNGTLSTRDVLEHNGGSVMVAVKDDGKIIMERQYRKTMDRIVLELPAGKRDDGENPVETARRELREETGYTAGSIEPLTVINPSCGYSAEMLHIYLCRDLVPGETDLDETEDLDLVEYTADELVEMILSNQIQDAKSIIGILYARTAGLI